jgi:hypothetical protein
MKTLNLTSYGVEEMNEMQMSEVNGGGDWITWEAAFCYCIAGGPGLIFYTIGTMQ